MSGTTKCPNCLASQFTDEAERDRIVHCESCGHVLVAQGCEPDGEPKIALPKEKYSLGNLAQLGVRLNSPLGWLAALILFFLPWVNLNCEGRRFAHVSGADLAWNDVSIRRGNAGQKIPVLGQDPAKDKAAQAVHNTIGSVLLTVYYVILALAFLNNLLFLAIDRRPVFILAMLMFFGAAIVALLFGASGSILGNPLWPKIDPKERTFLEYTLYYYGSYVANLWAVAWLGVECWMERSNELRRELEAGDDEPSLLPRTDSAKQIGSDAIKAEKAGQQS